MYREPSEKDLEKPEFNTIWNVIKTWDINVPNEYEGYSGATGNHVMAILDELEQLCDYNYEEQTKRIYREA